MVGYFEGIDSERGIAWRTSDSLSLRSFVRIALDESVPDYSTISRTRRVWKRTKRCFSGASSAG
jgi:transposase